MQRKGERETHDKAKATLDGAGALSDSSKAILEVGERCCFGEVTDVDFLRVVATSEGSACAADSRNWPARARVLSARVGGWSRRRRLSERGHAIRARGSWRGIHSRLGAESDRLQSKSAETRSERGVGESETRFSQVSLLPISSTSAQSATAVRTRRTACQLPCYLYSAPPFPLEQGCPQLHLSGLLALL